MIAETHADQAPEASVRDARRCIIYVASTSLYLANSRLPLMRRMLNEGWRVIAVAPEDQHTSRIRDTGCEVHALPIAREVGALGKHARLLFHLAALYRHERATIVHHFTANPIVYGSVAAKLAKVPATVNALTGMGSVFYSTSWDALPLRLWLKMGYRCASRLGNSRMIFQNAEDLQWLVSAGVVPRARATLVRSSGVDINVFLPTPEPPGVPTIVFCGRLLSSKGVGDLVAAARLLRAWQVPCRVHLVGWADATHRDAVPSQQLSGWEREGTVSWLGPCDDMPAMLAASHIVVLPSYGEGAPRSLIEAAACGRPVVATDTTGSREVVMHGRNGFLVPPRNPQALAEALATLARDGALRQSFGRVGREIAVNKFSDGSVIGATLAIYRDLTAHALMEPSEHAGAGA